MPRDLPWPRNQRFMWHLGWVSLIILFIPHHPSSSLIPIHSSSSLMIPHHTLHHSLSLIIFIFILHLPIFIPSSPLILLIPHPTCPYSGKFCDHRPTRKGDILFLIDHVTSREHVVNGLCGHYGWVSLILSHHRTGLMSLFVENT